MIYDDIDYFNMKIKLYEDLLKVTPKNLEKVGNSIDSYIDKINIIGAYENEEFYKISFPDAVNLILVYISR